MAHGGYQVRGQGRGQRISLYGTQDVYSGHQRGHMQRNQDEANYAYTTHGKWNHEANSYPYQGSSPQKMQHNPPKAQNPQHSPGKRMSMGHEAIVRLSKTLAFLLRHGAEKSGFTFMPGGFLYVDEVLWYHRPLWGFTDEHIQEVVRTNDKQRFALQKDHNGRLMIRANQGHTTAVQGLDLTPICDTSGVEMVVHGTYYEAWEQIKRTGLSRMNRNHIHFAAGMPGENGIISGMRKSCQVVIEINLEAALKAGIPFFRSANNVILSPGNDKGFIPPIFFKSVFNRHTGQLLLGNESSSGQDTSSPSVHVTKIPQYPQKRKIEDQKKDAYTQKRRKEAEPDMGSHKSRSEKERITSKSGILQCKEDSLERTKCDRPKAEKGDWGRSRSDRSQNEKKGGEESKSQNEKKKEMTRQIRAQDEKEDRELSKSCKLGDEKEEVSKAHNEKGKERTIQVGREDAKEQGETSKFRSREGKGESKNFLELQTGQEQKQEMTSQLKTQDNKEDRDKLRYGQWSENENREALKFKKSRDDKGDGKMSKSQNKKEKQ